MLTMTIVVWDRIAGGDDAKKIIATQNSADPCDPPAKRPQYLQSTDWPSKFQIKVNTHYRIGSNVVNAEQAAAEPGTMYYQWDESIQAMMADFPHCPPFAGLPEDFWGTHTQFYLNTDLQAEQGDRKYTCHAYCWKSMQYFLYTVNLGPVRPDFVARYHQIDPHPPTARPLDSSKLPMPLNSYPADLQWFTTGGPPPADDQGYYACSSQLVAGPQKNQQFKTPYNFSGGHLGLKGNTYLQAIYSNIKVGPSSFDSSIFTPPSGFKLIPPSKELPPLKLPVAGMTCAACHASTAPCVGGPPPGTASKK
jgi:hypothetical protein